MRRTATADAAAFFASVDDHVALFGMRFGADGAQGTTARIGAVSGVDVHMELI